MSWAWKKDLSRKDDDTAAWEPYPALDSTRIEHKYQENKKQTFSLDGTYLIDFNLMLQYRSDDHNRQRKIRRSELTYSGTTYEQSYSSQSQAYEWNGQGVHHYASGPSNDGYQPLGGDGDGSDRDWGEGLSVYGEGQGPEGVPWQAEGVPWQGEGYKPPPQNGIEPQGYKAPVIQQDLKQQSHSAQPGQLPGFYQPGYQPGYTPLQGNEGKLEGKQKFSAPPQQQPQQPQQPKQQPKQQPAGSGRIGSQQQPKPQQPKQQQQQAGGGGGGAPKKQPMKPVVQEDEKNNLGLSLLASVPCTPYKPKPVFRQQCNISWARWISFYCLIIFIGGIAEEVREFYNYVNMPDYLKSDDYKDFLNAVTWCVIFSIAGMLGWMLWMSLLRMATFVNCFYFISCLGVIVILCVQTRNLVQNNYDTYWIVLFIAYIAAEILGLTFWRIVIPISQELIPLFATEMLTGFGKRWQVMVIGFVGYLLQVFVILISAYHFLHIGYDIGRIILFMYLLEVTRNLIHYTSVRVYINQKHNYERKSMPILSELWIAISRNLWTIMTLSLFTQFEAPVTVTRKVTLSIVWGPCADKCSVCVIALGKCILALTDKILKFVARFTVTMAAYGSLGPCASVVALDRHDIGEMFTWWEFEPISKSLTLGAITFACLGSIYANSAVDGSALFFYVASYYLFRTLTEPLEALNNSNQLEVRNEKSHQGEAQLQQVNSKPYVPLQATDVFSINPFLKPPQKDYFFSCPKCKKHFQINQTLKIGDRIKCCKEGCSFEYSLEITDIYPWRFPFGIAYNPTSCCSCLCRPTDSHWDKIVVEKEFFYYKSKIRPTMLDSRQCIFRSIVQSFHRSKYLSDNFIISKVTLMDNPEIRARFENYVMDNKSTHARLTDAASIKELDAFRKHTVFRMQDLCVVKGWHGAHWGNLNSIAAKGFLNLKTTDEGFFGSGVYFAPQLEYAVRYSTGQLVSQTGKGYRPNMSGEFCVIMSFLAVAKPYYVTWGRDGDYKSGSRCRLFAKPIVQGHDANYVRVDSSFLLPLPGSPPVYEEIVIKDASVQALPCVALYYKLKNQQDF